MEFITEAIGMKKFAHEHFGLCVFAFNHAHVVAAYFRRVDIRYFSKVDKS